MSFRLPHGISSDSREWHLLHGLARTATSFSQRLTQLMEDDTRSESFKAAGSIRIADEAAAQHAKLAAEAEALANSFAAADAAEAVAPTLHPTDAVQALRDMHIVNYVREAEPKEVTRIAQELVEGKNTPFLLALARSPIPLPPVIAAVIKGCLVDHLVKRDPETARLRNDKRASMSFLTDVLNQSAAALPRPLTEAAVRTRLAQAGVNAHLKQR
jgi:hypothetical protein